MAKLLIQHIPLPSGQAVDKLALTHSLSPLPACEFTESGYTSHPRCISERTFRNPRASGEQGWCNSTAEGACSHVCWQLGQGKGGKACRASYMTRLSCSRLLPVPNVMNQHAADNKHNYHAIYQHIPLGGRTITQSLHLKEFPELSSPWRAYPDWNNYDFLHSLYKVQIRGVGALHLNRYGGLFRLCFFNFVFTTFCNPKQQMENVGGKLQGEEIQVSKTLLFLSVGAGLNVHPRQASHGRVW